MFFLFHLLAAHKTRSNIFFGSWIPEIPQNPQDGRGERRMGIPGWCCEGFHVARVRVILMGFNYESIGVDWIYMEFTLQ